MSSYSDTAARLARVAPQIRPAGVAADYNRPSVRDLTSSYSPDSCPTPDGIKKFHHRGPDVDAIHRHWGSAADEPADTTVRYGIRSHPNGCADESLRPDLYADRVSTLIGEQRAKTYASERQHPLGRVPDPSFEFETPVDGFGKPSGKGESTASTLAAMREVNVRHEAGEQTDRQYDWLSVGIDPTQHRFGTQSDRCERASDLLHGTEQTVLMPKTVADYKSTVDYEIGKSRSYGFDDPALWDETRRRPAKAKACASNGFQAEQPTVGELLSTWAIDKPKDDATGGRGKDGTTGSSGSGADSTHRAGDDDFDARRTVDTITRLDKTVAALAKMGDDATARQLVHPSHYVSRGVQSKYFAGGRSLEDIRALSEKCGFGLSDAQVDEVFGRIAVDGMCGIEQFKNAAMARGYL